MEKQLQQITQDLILLTEKIKKLELEIVNLEDELLKSDLYKKICDKKIMLTELETDYKEKEKNTIKTMVSMWLNSIDFWNRNFTMVQNLWIVEVLDEIKIPREYFKEKIITSLDKETLSIDLRKGKLIDGAILEADRRIKITEKES